MKDMKHFKFNDPFIYYVLNTQDELKKMQDENQARVDKEEILNQCIR
jgi:hypothetical protein